MAKFTLEKSKITISAPHRRDNVAWDCEGTSLCARAPAAQRFRELTKGTKIPSLQAKLTTAHFRRRPKVQ